ncbi:hypothetical protein CVV38_01750 [Candidatus Peregrinibacteria bacterium HGW-Peregrinibacteria-1]|jgi:hypothetical protein|nr:MAG: hypothetical protein CVV38_01750 [Candidatus Peregrinibacteria bacterium HGW-Peregrinibacteria-1]
MTKNQKPLTWKTTERPAYNRGKTWYLIAGILATALFVGTIIYRSYTFSLVIIASIVAYGLTHFKKPAPLQVELNQYDVKIGKITYPYSKIKSFFLITEAPFRTLYLRIPSTIAINVALDLGKSTDPNEIRNFLISKIPEESQPTPILDTLLRILKI